MTEALAVVPREALGRWPKGTSGNPGGRPKAPANVKAFAPIAGDIMIQIAKGEVIDEHFSRGQAAAWCYERSYARPAPDLGEEGEAVNSYIALLVAGASGVKPPVTIDAEFTETKEST